MKIRATIRTKFLLPTILLIVVGMGGSSAISYIKAKNSLQKALVANIEQSAKSTAALLQNWVADRKVDIKGWSQEELYARALQDSFMGKAARAAATDRLFSLKNEYGYYEDIAIANIQGNILAASIDRNNEKEQIPDFNIKDRAYFKAAVTDQIFVSEALKSRKSGHPVFFIAAPIKDKNGIQGVIFSLINIKALAASFIDPIKIGESGYAFMLDHSGLTIAHPDKSQIMQTNMADFDFGREMLEKKSGIISYSYEGVRKQVAFISLETLNWIVAVNIPHEEMIAPAVSLGRVNFLVAMAVIAVATVLIIFITSTVVKPINQVVAGLKDVAEGDGDLTKRIEVKSQDEVAELARWFNVFIEKIQIIISDVAHNATNLNNASKELAGISELMSNGADQTSSKANTVAVAAEEMSANITSVATVMDMTVNNLGMVAGAAEEMSATINEIAKNTERGREITDQAVGQTSEASSQIEELGSAAQQIGKVVEAITEISEQVNLLALNATIEAARAGDAGKGFAVVANEIKELARQTADASGEIKKQVDGIQRSTDGTISRIEGIMQVVGKVSDIVTTIATSVEEQSVTTREIAGNVANASQGLSEVNESVSQSSKVATDIAEEISEVMQAANEMSNSSSQVNASSSELANLAGKLNEMVGRFRV